MLEHLAPELPWFERFMFSNLWLFSGAIEHEMLKSFRSAASIRTTTAPTIIKVRKLYLLSVLFFANQA